MTVPPGRRRHEMKRPLFVLLLVVISTTGAAAAPRFTLTDLGHLGSGFSAAVDLNERGQVLMWSLTDRGYPLGYVWEHGRVRMLERVADLTIPTAISDDDCVIGTVYLNGEWHGVMWEAGNTRVLGPGILSTWNRRHQEEPCVSRS
jgi:hypothetical protein